MDGTAHLRSDIPEPRNGKYFRTYKTRDLKALAYHAIKNGCLFVVVPLKKEWKCAIHRSYREAERFAMNSKGARIYRARKGKGNADETVDGAHVIHGKQD